MSSPEVTTAQQHQEHRLILSHDSHGIVHGTGTIARFNTWLAVRITKTVGTMWIAYVFAAIALISLPAAIQSRSVIVIVAWIAQTFFQLVLLPIIIVGQNVIQATNDARAEADHETLSAVHKLTIEVHAINEAQSAILRQLQAASA
jgi:dolichyl-phosphate-mannose--protein O-mannosyl transferase